MKIRILIIIPVFFLSGFLRSVIYPQQAFNYYINALSGLEDTKGNTHLFYKLHEFYNDKIPPREIIRLHNLDVENNKDVVFQSYGRLCNNIACIDTLILDFEFWNNNPQDFVLAGTIDAGTDPIAFIRTRDTIKHFKGIQAIYNVEVSKQESNLIFYSINASSGSPVKVLAKSTDKGRSWGSISSQYFDLVSVDPYNDKVIFGLSSNGFPVKSTDQGKTSRQVIEQYMNNMDNRIFYDADSVHIYWVSERFVYASDKTGDSLSWRKIHEGRQKVYLASDSKNTGRIFLAEGKYILFSSDYGKTFHLLCKLESPVNGIYLKPGTERLFVTTRYSIFEVTKDSLKVIKNFTLPKYLLGFYPLKRGNKWFFTETVSDYPKNIIYDMTRSVTGDTIMPNKKRYHIIKEMHSRLYDNRTFYERIDSSGGKIFTYTADSSFADNELLLDDLSIAPGDTVYSSRYRPLYSLPGGFRFMSQFLNEKEKYFWNKALVTRSYQSRAYPMDVEYELTNGLGLTWVRLFYDMGFTADSLKGCIIDGVSYGDTNAVVSVNENSLTIDKYCLYQNYPNPFNPSTIISYSIGESRQVKLDIFDILGREVAHLIDQKQNAGIYNVKFDGSALPAGIYIYRITAGGFIDSKKFVLVK